MIVLLFKIQSFFIFVRKELKSTKIKRNAKLIMILHVAILANDIQYCENFTIIVKGTLLKNNIKFN